MKKNISLILTLALFLAIGAWAQAPRGDRGRSHFRPIPEEVKSYLKENVLPTLTAQRATLDLELSDQEIEEIAEIREELKELKVQKQALHGSLRDLKESFEGEGRPELPEELRSEMRTQQKRHRQLMTQAWEIADTHEEAIEEVLAELKPQAQQWRTDIRSLLEENRGERKEGQVQKGERGRRGEGRRGNRRGHREGMRGGGLIGKWHHPVAFLLFDGSLPEIESSSRGDLQIFPNPSSRQNQVEYTVEQSGMVEINLLDKSGKTLKQLVSTPKEAGSYTLSVDLTDLGPGVYLYQIKTTSGIQTRKVLVE